MKRKVNSGDEIILKDGQRLLRGPYQNIDEEARQKNGFNICIEIPSNITARNAIGIKIVQIFNPVGDITLPIVLVQNEYLWNRALFNKVIELLRKDGKGGKKIDYIVSRVESGIYEKRLPLRSRNKLIGGLRFILDDSGHLTAAYKDLIIWGEIKDSDGEFESTILFTISSLYSLDHPGTDIIPRYKKNKDVWCEALEGLVVGYLKTLAYFSRGNMSQQIAEVADQLSAPKRLPIIQRVIQKLAELLPADQIDPEVQEALRQIDEFHPSNKEDKL